MRLKKILALFISMILLIGCNKKNNLIYERFPDKAIDITKERIISEEDFLSLKYKEIKQGIRISDRLDDEIRKIFAVNKYIYGRLIQRDVYQKLDGGEYFRIEKYDNDVLNYSYYLLDGPDYIELEYKRSGRNGEAIFKYKDREERYKYEYLNPTSTKKIKIYYKIYSKDGKLLKEGEKK